MSDIYKINVSMLKSYEKDFRTQLNNFNNKTYTTFSSSYLKNCSDTYVYRMSNELQNLYDIIKNGYQNIDKWWIDYNTNIEGLENYLSDNGSIGAIPESSIRNSANRLPNLKKYNLKFAGIIPKNMVGESYTTAFTNNTVVSTVDPFSSIYSDYRVSEVNASETVNDSNIVNNQKDETISTTSTSMASWTKNIGSGIKELFVSTKAKISSFGGNVIIKTVEVIENVDNLFDETKAYIANKVESLWDKTHSWWNDTTLEIDNWFNEVGTNISNDAKSLWTNVTDWWSNVEDWWNSDALPWIENAASIVWDVVKSVGATIAVFVQSLVEGILQFGEAILDFVALVGTGAASIVTGLIDGGQAIYGAITGNEWSSITKKMWNETMGYVSNQYVSESFDLLYQKTGYGQWLTENAYVFDITRSIGSGIGYIAGVVVLTIATFGVGSAVTSGGSLTVSAAAAATTSSQMAVTATAAGIGRGTQNAWADGANLLEGLSAGTLTGLWEGFQFYVGGKIGKLELFGTDGIFKAIGLSGLKTKLLNALARVVLDGADGGVEGFVIPLITSIYKDGYKDENGNYIEFSDDDNIFERYKQIFVENGGWTNVWTQATIGSATSLLGEVFDLRKYFKDADKTKAGSISDNSGATAALESGRVSSSNITSLDDQIAMANYHAGQGRSVLEIDNIGDVTKEVLDKIDDPSNVMFRIGDQTYSYLDIKQQIGLAPTGVTVNLNSLDDQIAMANYYTNKGNFYQINIDAVDEFTLNKLNQLQNLDDIIIMYEGNNYSILEFKNIINSENSLKGQLLKSVDGIDNPLLKARKLYMELNKKLHYDMDFVKADRVTHDQILDKITTFENIGQGNRVICKGWSELFQEALIDSGFDESSVRINTAGIHRWVEIDLGNGYIIQADATDAINKSIDLAASKAGYGTSGFICIDNQNGNWNGVRPSSIVNSESCKNMIDNNNQLLLEVDQYLGYAGSQGYLVDELTKAKELFGTSQVINELSNDIVEQQLDAIFNMELPPNMDGYEVYAYYRKISDNLFGKDYNPIKLDTLFLKTSNGVEPINLMSALNNRFQLYSTSLGIMQFNSLQDLKTFIDSLDLIK